MLRSTKLLFLVAVVALVAFGCSNQGDQSNPLMGQADPTLAAAVMPGDPVQSATLFVYVNTPSGQPITVHRITSDWAEMGVTWNNFGGAFDAAVEGGFTSDAMGWKTSDVTGLVQGWLAGDNTNFGLLLKQGGELVPRTHLASRESANIPMLEVCYLTSAGPECVQYTAMADASIMENYPNDNTGGILELFCGWYSVETLEKQSLIRFELPPPPPDVASIGDYVWLDDNQNGIQDADELGFPGAEVMLYNCQGNLVGTTTTDADGYYLFDNLIPGDYNVVFVLPEDYVFSPQNQGMDNTMDSDPDPSTGVAACTTLDPGEHDPTWDAGLFRPPWEGCSLTIGYWKTHAGFGPQDDVVTPLLPISLGAIDVTNATEAHDILVQKYCGGPSNGLVKLTAQFLAVMLNGANGADLGAVADEIDEAHQILTDYSCEDWKRELSKSEKKMVINLKNAFDDYNNGVIGPGHCDDFGDDD